MVDFTRLKVPAFDLCYLDPIGNHSGYVVFACGGGSAKTGVKNQLVFARETSIGKFECVDSFETDSPERSVLCSGVCSGVIHVCAKYML